jgi:hypothetical protein
LNSLSTSFDNALKEMLAMWSMTLINLGKWNRKQSKQQVIKPVAGEADCNKQDKALFSNLSNVSSYNNELRPNEVDNE